MEDGGRGRTMGRWRWRTSRTVRGARAPSTSTRVAGVRIVLFLLGAWSSLCGAQRGARYSTLLFVVAFCSNKPRLVVSNSKKIVVYTRVSHLPFVRLFACRSRTSFAYAVRVRRSYAVRASPNSAANYATRPSASRELENFHPSSLMQSSLSLSPFLSGFISF